MTDHRLCGGILSFCVLVVGCIHAPGGPRSSAEIVRPDRIRDFSRLYAQNCSGCHGADGLNGPAIPLANPIYQGLVDDETLRSTITNGEPGTLMPAFAQSAGGMLTNGQVDVLVKGIRSRWYDAGVLKGLDTPSYKNDKKGDVARGQRVFNVDCLPCHGSGAQGRQASSVTDGSYLALVSDQSLRAIIIAGRPDIGQPDWRSVVPGHPLSDEDVTDVVAWIASQRVRTPGQPYPIQP